MVRFSRKQTPQSGDLVPLNQSWATRDHIQRFSMTRAQAFNWIARWLSQQHQTHKKQCNMLQSGDLLTFSMLYLLIA
jgi:hypothetical protein